eukprot:7166653-Pyramimonas_sp.AAC.1
MGISGLSSGQGAQVYLKHNLRNSLAAVHTNVLIEPSGNGSHACGGKATLIPEDFWVRTRCLDAY